MRDAYEARTRSKLLTTTSCDAIAIAADKGGYTPDISMLSLQQAIKVMNDYFDLQRVRAERQAEIQSLALKVKMQKRLSLI